MQDIDGRIEQIEGEVEKNKTDSEFDELVDAIEDYFNRVERDVIAALVDYYRKKNENVID